MTSNDKVMFFDAMLASTDKKSILRLVKNSKRNRENAKKFVSNLFQCSKSNIVIRYRKGKRSPNAMRTHKDVIKKGAKAFDVYVRSFDASESIKWKYHFLFAQQKTNIYTKERERLNKIKQEISAKLQYI